MPTKVVTALTDHTPPPPDLVDHLRQSGHIDRSAKFDVLYGGRTNLVWKVLGDRGDKVLKLYRNGPRNPMFRNDPRLEAQCLHQLEPTGFTPRLCVAGRHAAGHWVFYDHAPGVPWRTDAGLVGGLLRRLHMLAVPVNAPQGCNGSDDLATHTQSILSQCSSGTKEQIAQLRPVQHVAPTPATHLIHGDPVPGNILASGTDLTLIDWQCPVIGDPSEDLAIFLSPAMQYLYRGTVLTAAEEDEFLSAYNRPEITRRYKELRPWYAWRMAAYCLWKTERGASDYVQGLELELATLR